MSNRIEEQTKNRKQIFECVYIFTTRKFEKKWILRWPTLDILTIVDTCLQLHLVHWWYILYFVLVPEFLISDLKYFPFIIIYFDPIFSHNHSTN